MPSVSDAQRRYRDEYLRSEHWKLTRAAALERANHRCQVCNSPSRLDVHHRTYERLGAERPEDLTVLCRRCHDLYHQSKKVVTVVAPAPARRVMPREPKRSKARCYPGWQEDAKPVVLTALRTSPDAFHTAKQISRDTQLSSYQASQILIHFAKVGVVRKAHKKKHYQLTAAGKVSDPPVDSAKTRKQLAKQQTAAALRRHNNLLHAELSAKRHQRDIDRADRVGRCRAVLTRGPAITRDVAAQAGMTAMSAGATLASMQKQGLVSRATQAPTAPWSLTADDDPAVPSPRH